MKALDETDGYVILGVIIFLLLTAFFEYKMNPDTNYESTKGLAYFIAAFIVIGYIFYVVFMGGFRDFN